MSSRYVGKVITCDICGEDLPEESFKYRILPKNKVIHFMGQSPHDYPLFTEQLDICRVCWRHLRIEILKKLDEERAERRTYDV